jgi:hypothetical protein
MMEGQHASKKHYSPQRRVVLEWRVNTQARNITAHKEELFLNDGGSTRKQETLQPTKNQEKNSNQTLVNPRRCSWLVLSSDFV